MVSASMTQQEKLELFVEDSKVKLECLGPYIRLRLLVKAVEDFPTDDRALLICLFGVNYDAAAAFTLYDHINDLRVDWLQENWPDFRSLHKERRTTASPIKTYNCVQAILTWFYGDGPGADQHLLTRLERYDEAHFDAFDLYDRVFEDVRRIPSFGRYISIRIALGLCESILGRGQGKSILPEGSFVRKSLALWYPDYEEALMRNGSEAEALAESLGREQREDLRVNYDLELTPLAHTEFLCEFRQAMRGRFYSSRPLDENLRNNYRQEKLGTNLSDLWKARSRHIPEQYLGECNGWDGPRHDLHPWMRDHGTLAP